jgi:hypothetical protein
MGYSDVFIGLCYGFFVDPSSVEKFRNFSFECFESYVSNMRQITDVEKDGVKVAFLSASGNDFSGSTSLDETTPFIAFHEIKVSGWHELFFDPAELVKKEREVTYETIRFVKKWAKENGLILNNRNPKWFALENSLYFDRSEQE